VWAAARRSLSLGLAAAACASGCASHAAHEPPSSLGGRASTQDSEPDARDAIVVLGHRPPLSAGVLAYETRARVDRGVGLFVEGRAPRLLFSGGPSTPEAVEADVMASYAAQRGVPEAALRRERASRDTIENARLSVAMLRRELGRERRPRIVLVTSDYHVERASRLFRCAGAEVDSVSVPLVLSPRERRKKRRNERYIQIYYWFIDECARAAAGD
jgi:uncharacterized SAM-binding protein YcdF (DUF218 family)